ncbi:heat-inducible transcriptional repressor HrcA [Dialister micraerophilus]|uniref:Heat-inducible transcription repressor HrcA n=1 Tax=Dialister micraerophilus UPII 345-E TaxID=910314 RepID=E4LAD4_9FIRM|nr:heat-inducible transcriptional repressor HrcA [Dialister micraerophilus]EFR42157.1 heat-inducible transcription repressor HrcA [Dialister micraerophilus UPII 345-E]
MNKNKGQNDKKNMNERKKRILWAIVQDYSETAEPVGSRTVAKKYDLGVSSATIRNDMQDLEDEGYLEQPHTSAGRVPSIKGYRFYVDELMMPNPVTQEEQKVLHGIFEDSSKRVDEIFCNMAKIIASLTHTLSLSASAKGKSGKFNYVRFLPLDKLRAILLVVTDSGDVTDVVVKIPEGTDLDELQMLANKLNRFLHGKELKKLDEKTIMEFQREISKNLVSYIPVFRALNQAIMPSREIYSGGASALIEQPEFRDIERVQDLLNLLEERELLHRLLMESMDKPISVNIGTENNMKSFSDLSIIRAQFTCNNQVIGSIAVLGPTRMEYGKIVGMLNFMQKQLDFLLKDKDT